MRISYCLYFASVLAITTALYSPSDDVIELTANNFENQVKNSDDVWFVEFYAPWCGHCQSLAPEWKKAATALKGVVKVGAVDMDVHSSVGGPYGIRGFPTIKIFGLNKNSPQDYQGARSAQAITSEAINTVRSVVSQRLSGGGKSSGSRKQGGGGGGSKQGNKEDVIELTDSNFEEMVLNSKDLWLVEFFAPWCGHCQRLAPEWAKAATELKGKVKLGAVDATVHQGLAGRYQVQGYPTIKVFEAGAKDDSSGVNYEGGRTASDIIQFALNKMEASLPPPEIIQLLNNDILKENCQEKQLCVISFLPDILDSGAEGRNTYIKILKELGDKYKSKGWGWIWTESFAQEKLEKALEIGGFGYPALAAVNVRKMKYATLRGSFDRNGIDEFLRALSVGRGSTAPIKGASLPDIVTLEAWDGKDGQLPVEDDYDLDDFDMDEDDKKKKEEL